jgi:hypothetical protein
MWADRLGHSRPHHPVVCRLRVKGFRVSYTKKCTPAPPHDAAPAVRTNARTWIAGGARGAGARPRAAGGGGALTELRGGALTRPRLSNSSYQSKSICRWAVRGASERACGTAERAAAAGSQTCTRSSPAPRPQPLRKLRRRTRSVRQTWERCGVSSEGEGPGQHSCGRACGRAHAVQRRRMRCSAEAGSHCSRPHS